jgi:hypothetical protein
MKSETKTRRSTFLVVVPASLFVCLLAFAVFGWGLHSKLSLYHVGAQTSSKIPVAKLLSERERPEQDLSVPVLSPASLRRLAIVASIMLPRIPVCSAEWRRDPSPPPQRLIAVEGPSLLRPPPFLG